MVAEIRGVFGSVGVYACVCESKSWPLLFFVQQKPNSEWYSRPFLSQKYMPDCRKSHLIFQNFLGEAPRPPAGARAFGALFGISPPYRAPLSKIPGSALDERIVIIIFIMSQMTVATCNSYSNDKHWDLTVIAKNDLHVVLRCSECWFVTLWVWSDPLQSSCYVSLYLAVCRHLVLVEIRDEISKFEIFIISWNFWTNCKLFTEVKFTIRWMIYLFI